MIFRIWFRLEAAHVRCHLFVAPRRDCTFASCGEFTVRQGDEFRALMGAFNADFIGADPEVGTVAVAQQSAD